MNDRLPVPTSSGPLLPEPGYQYAGPMDDLPAPAPAFHLQKYLVFLRRFWWVPVLTLILSVGSVGAYIYFFMKPTYVSKASMWETEKLRLPGGALFDEDQQSFVGTQSELLRSPYIAGLAIKRLRADTSIFIPLDDKRQPLEPDIKVTPAPKSSVFQVQSRSPYPGYTRAYLEALMKEFLEYKRNIRQVVSGDTLASISTQTTRLESELKEAERKLTEFQRSNNLAVLQEEGTIAGNYLARLKTQLSDYELEGKLLEATAREQEASGAATNSVVSLLDNVRSPTSGGNPNQVSYERQTAYKDLELLKMQRDRLAKVLKPKHPKMKKLDEDIARGNAIVEMYRTQNREQLAAAREANRMRVTSVQVQIKDWEVKVANANNLIAEANKLEQDVARTKSLHERLRALVENVNISRNIDQSTLNILDPASDPERSYKQEISLAALSVLGGLGLGLAFIFLAALRDDRFSSVIEINEKIGDNIVGQVPEVIDVPGRSPLLLEEGEDRHTYVESYRSLRSALLFLASEGRRPRVILVTSALPNEGKSTIATNLARTLAQGGARVLLVDADLRKGSLHELMGLQRAPGLTELLRGTATVETAVQSNSVPNLQFVATGARLRNPGDLFLGQNLKRLLDAWREQYDYVIVDSCPVFAADDATTLAPKVDGTLFIVRSRFSGARQVREALELLYQRQAKVLGVVFNRADSSSRSYYYYKYAEYAAAGSEPT